MPEEIKPNTNPRSERTNVHDLESGRALTNREISAEIRNQDKPPLQIGRRKKRFIKTPVGKIAVVAAALIGGASAYKATGDAIDHQYGLGAYGHQKTAQEQTMEFKAGTLKEDKILNGTVNIKIKNEDGSSLALRSEPKIPDLSKGEKDNKIDWSQVMAIKTEDGKEYLINGENEFSITGKVKFVNGRNPIGATGDDGGYAAFVLVLASGQEMHGFINSSPLTRSHMKLNGILTDSDGKNSLTINE